MPESELAREWKRIESWLRGHAPKLARALRTPATERALADLERGLGRPLPDELREWLAVHDGQDPGAFEVLGRWTLLGAEGIRSTFDALTAMDRRFGGGGAVAHGPVEPRFWSTGWIPIARDAAGDAVCVDTRPAPGGAIGQIIEYRHDDGVRTVLAPSLGRWFAAFADDLEGDRYTVDDFLGSLAPREE